MHPISEVLCDVYVSLVKKEQVNFVLHDEHRQKIDSIVKTVYSNFFGFVRYPEVTDQAAAFFYYIIKNHPVVDGNKRFAVLWLEIFTITYNLKLTLPSGITLDALAVSVEQSNLNHENTIQIIKEVLFIT